MGPISSTILLFVILIVFAVGIILAIRHERKSFNNGKCPHCGSDLKWEDSDSQGGRLWMCPTHYAMKDESGKPLCPGYSCWVSWPSVDKKQRCHHE